MKIIIDEKKIISLLKKLINEDMMNFDTQDRPNKDIIDKTQTGNTPLKSIPFPKTNGDSNFQEILASERYKQVLDNVRRYTGINDTVKGMEGLHKLIPLMYSAHNEIIQIESNHKKELEQLAINLVINEMGLNPDDVNFDAKIIGMGEVDNNGFNMNNTDTPDQVDIDNDQMEIEIFNDLENLNLERAKRRLINSLIQGASKRGHYMYHLVSEKLQEITGSEKLLDLYGIMMSVNDLNYWQIGDVTIESMSDSKAGSMTIDNENENGNFTIKARGVNFPVLLHELLKGVYELIGSHGLPENPETAKKVIEVEDVLNKEMWDLRLGPAIWDRVKNQLPDEVYEDDGKVLQQHIFMYLFKLPAKRFLLFMREVMSGSDEGKKMMNDFVVSIKKRLSQQEYEDSIEEFNNNLNKFEDNNDDDIDDLLNELGLSVE